MKGLCLEKFNRDELKRKFLEASPVNYICIDNFMDSIYLSDVLNEIKSIPKSVWEEIPDGIHNEPDNEVFNNKLSLFDFGEYPKIKEAFDLLQSNEMIKFLEDVTGIKGLQNDPDFSGGGIHRISKGGRLSIHSDFNLHPLNDKHRRLNAILYLNKDWIPRYNGEFEFWTSDMMTRTQTIPPIFNRMVIFRITDTAFHGHPIPWEGPDGKERLSMALYYYTDDRPEEEKSPFHWALWQKRYGIDF